MDSPSEYVAKLEADLRRERTLRERAERERDEYQSQLHSAGEVRTHMTSAASLAAGDAVVALNRLQEANAIVDVAIAWFGQRKPDYQSGRLTPAERDLCAILDAHLKRKASQS